jgi:hypothetical protein
MKFSLEIPIYKTLLEVYNYCVWIADALQDPNYTVSFWTWMDACILVNIYACRSWSVKPEMLVIIRRGWLKNYYTSLPVYYVEFWLLEKPV